MKELQTSVPHAVSLVHVAKFPNVKWAEKRLHDALASRNVQASGGTEFFFLSAMEAVAIVNGLAYQVSVYEAEKALKRDLETFREKVSHGLSGKFAIWFAVATVIGWMGMIVANGGGGSAPEFLFLLFFTAMPLAIFGGVIGVGVGDGS